MSFCSTKIYEDNERKKNILIAGATAGTGSHTVKLLASGDINVFIKRRDMENYIALLLKIKYRKKEYLLMT